MTWRCPSRVVPYVGTWIEIRTSGEMRSTYEVVPYVGTWIEIFAYRANQDVKTRRSLRGNVDRNNMTEAEKDRNWQSFPTWERG